MLKRATPKVWLPFLAVAWGILAMCLGFVRSYGSFMAVRALLGLAEGGLLPGMVLYLSGLYTRSEMALRIGIFYTAASLSGAFGGINTLPFLSLIGPFLFRSRLADTAQDSSLVACRPSAHEGA